MDRIYAAISADIVSSTSLSREALMELTAGVKVLPLVATLLNKLINKATRRQYETLFHKLQCKSENEVAARMGISRPGVNQNQRSMGWEAVERAIKYFEQLGFEGK